MNFTIAIICSNDILLEKCLKSIDNQVPTMVILNYPSKEVLEILKKFKNIQVYQLDERNLGKLRELAVTKCKTKAICFVDSDSVIDKDLVKTLKKELLEYEAINIPLHFLYNNLTTKIVSLCRSYTTPDNLLYMPFAFHLSLEDKIGKLFNENLYWGEDSDQRKRLKEKNIPYGISKSVVYHKPLTFKEDLKSAKRLGLGTYVQEQNGLSEKRSFLKDLSIIREIKGAHKCHKKTDSLLASLYHFFLWRPVYKYGYWKVRLHDCKSKN